MFGTKTFVKRSGSKNSSQKNWDLPLKFGQNGVSNSWDIPDMANFAKSNVDLTNITIMVGIC